MKNIAIILGASKYQRLPKLSGSLNDAYHINEILRLTDKYDDILYLNEDKSSQETKDSIFEFIEKYKIEKINEFFFYFSGHGDFINDEFYYLLVDFDTFKRNQTSLQNNVIDDLIRSLNPQLTVKVIDACNSGNHYVKDGQSINIYLDSSKKSLKNCYFLFSSQTDQSSYQSKYISHFTNSFINSIKTHTSSEIRYRNITDFIADEFYGNPEQKPLFIVQAENTEKFCTINQKLKDFLVNYTGIDPKFHENSTKKGAYAPLVIEEAKQYCNEEEANIIISNLKAQINTFQLDKEIDSLYEIKTNFINTYEDIKDLEVIASFLNKHKDDNNYFVKISFKTVTKEEEVYSKPYYIGENYVTGMQTGIKKFDVLEPSSFELTFEPEYSLIDIDLNPKFPNLTKYNCKMLFVISRKFIRFFYCINFYVEESWNKESLSKNTSWKTEEHPLKNSNAVKKYLEFINSEINETIIKKLNEKFQIEATKK